MNHEIYVDTGQIAILFGVIAACLSVVILKIHDLEEFSSALMWFALGAIAGVPLLCFLFFGVTPHLPVSLGQMLVTGTLLFIVLLILAFLPFGTAGVLIGHLWQNLINAETQGFKWRQLGTQQKIATGVSLLFWLAVVFFPHLPSDLLNKGGIRTLSFNKR